LRSRNPEIWSEIFGKVLEFFKALSELGSLFKSNQTAFYQKRASILLPQSFWFFTNVLANAFEPAAAAMAPVFKTILHTVQAARSNLANLYLLPVCLTLEQNSDNCCSTGHSWQL
jgi:hypothetical protein